MKVYHLYANEVNIGDFGAAEGIKILIKKYVDSDVVFKNVHIAYRDLNTAEINDINNTADFVIIGGGGLYWPYSKKLLLRLSYKSIKRIRKPIITYAIGVNYEKINWFRKYILHRNIYFLEKKLTLSSVRDVLSVSWLKDQHTNLVPCPSMFIDGRDKQDKSKVRKEIGIVLIPFSRLDKKQCITYKSELSDCINQLKKEYTVYLISHSKTIDDSYYYFSEQNNVKMILPSDAIQLMDTYKQMDLIVGSRGHMAIFATGANVPFLNLSYNVKCDAYTEMITYPDELTIQIGKQLTSQDVLNGVEYILEHYQTLQDTLETAKREALEKNIDFLKKIKQYV